MHDQDAFEEEEWISKSQLKREAEELKQLGKDLVAMSATKLATIPMSDELSEAIKLAKRLQDKKEALRRHYNYVGKVMRNEDIEAIEAALERLKNAHLYEAKAQQQLEQVREQLLAEGDSAINLLLEQYPQLERQKLRQLLRQAKKELAQEKPGKAYKEILAYLKQATRA